MRGYSQRLREYPFFSCLALGVPRPKARKMKRKIKTVRLLANFFRDEYYGAYKELIRQLSPLLQNPDQPPARLQARSSQRNQEAYLSAYRPAITVGRWCFQETLLSERPLPLAGQSYQPRCLIPDHQEARRPTDGLDRLRFIKNPFFPLIACRHA